MKNIVDESPILEEDSQEYKDISQFISKIGQEKIHQFLIKFIRKNLFSLSTIVLIATLCGFISIFSYLNEINNLALFPDILSNFQTFITILFYPLTVLVALIIFFLTPCSIYFIGKCISFERDDEKNKKIKSSIKKLFYTNLFWIITIILMIIFCSKDINFWTISLLIPYFLTNLWSFDIDLKDDIKIVWKLFLYFLVHNLFSLIAFITALIVIWKLINSVFLIFTILLLLVIFYIGIGKTVISDVKVENSIKKERVIGLGLISIYCAVMFIYIIHIMNDNLYKQSLQAIRFIESPKNSSWYLIYNNTQSQASNSINGLNSENIAKIKNEFTPTLKDKDGNLITTNKKNAIALYGYMAWNLGTTKVFCPDSVNNFSDKPDKEQFKKCLVINGNNLQIIDETYIE